MSLVPTATLHALVRLAAAAVKMHAYQTHYGKCDVCDLVHEFARLASEVDVDVTGLRKKDTD